MGFVVKLTNISLHESSKMAPVLSSYISLQTAMEQPLIMECYGVWLSSEVMIASLTFYEWMVW